MRIGTAGWVQIGGIIVLAAAIAWAWKFTPLRELGEPERLAPILDPLRASPFALLVVVAIFVLAGAILFPVLALVFATGFVFGPWLGALYALLGSLASAVASFWLGRKLGRDKLERLGGEVVRKLSRALKERGIVAIFLVRKIPGPFALVNMVCGASPVVLRDFVLGTVLGMSPGVVLLTFIASRFADDSDKPVANVLLIGAGVLAVALTTALLLQRAVNARMEQRS